MLLSARMSCSPYNREADDERTRARANDLSLAPRVLVISGLTISLKMFSPPPRYRSVLAPIRLEAIEANRNDSRPAESDEQQVRLRGDSNGEHGSTGKERERALTTRYPQTRDVQTSPRDLLRPTRESDRKKNIKIKQNTCKKKTRAESPSHDTNARPNDVYDREVSSEEKRRSDQQRAIFLRDDSAAPARIRLNSIRW